MLGDCVVRFRGEASQFQRSTEMSYRVSRTGDMGGETKLRRPFIVGDDEPPSRSEATGIRVTNKALEPLETQRRKKGDAEVHAPNDVSGGLLSRLRFVRSALNDAISEIHLEIHRVNVDRIVCPEAAQDFDKFDPQDVGQKENCASPPLSRDAGNQQEST